MVEQDTKARVVVSDSKDSLRPAVVEVKKGNKVLSRREVQAAWDAKPSYPWPLPFKKQRVRIAEAQAKLGAAFHNATQRIRRG